MTGALMFAHLKGGGNRDKQRKPFVAELVTPCGIPAGATTSTPARPLVLRRRR